MNYIQKKDLGFKKENLVVIDRAGVLDKQQDAFRQELLKNPSIRQVSKSSEVPGGLIGDNAYLPEGAEVNQTYALNNITADFHFLEAYGLELMEGRWFQEDNPTDSTAIILNEAAVKAFGYEDPVDKRIYMMLGEEREEPLPVIGVVKDFHFQSLHQEIKPLIIHFAGFRTGKITVKISGNQTAETLAYIDRTWSAFKEEQPIDRSFLDEDLEELYHNEERIATVFSLFSVLAIFIAALGLLGLASFSAAQRTKEVGIRKAMGASISNVLITLSREYVWLILYATVVSWPMGYFFMKDWLQDYPMRISLEPMVFVISSLLAFLIAAVTVILRVYQAASTNPVQSLRYE
jgi:putative ABC transport system permease protein